MRIFDWPLYISDTGHVGCYYQGRCDEDFSVAGRRTTVRELIQAIRDHAESDHDVTLEK